MGIALPARLYGWLFVATAAGRLAIALLLRDHWGWQPSYHLVFLQPADFYDPATHEYMVRQMPLYPAFLKALRDAGLPLYTTAPLLQNLFQLGAIALLAYRLARNVLPGRQATCLVFAFVLGLDPWLADTATTLQPASVTATLFIVLVERSAMFGTDTIETSRLPALWKVAVASGALGAAGAYMRADFATYSVLPALTVAVCGYATGAVTLVRATAFLVKTTLVAVGLVIVLLLPRSFYLKPHTGTLVLTTNTGGGALWAGLGEIPNPWNIPNPEDGDIPIEQFAHAHGYASPFGSARTSTFFKDLFWEHVRERPSILPKVFVFRIHRMLLGWPPQSVSFVGDYVTRPEIVALGPRLLADGWVRVTFSRNWAWMIKQFGLRYVGTVLIWLTLAGAALFLMRYRSGSPLLLLPLLAYTTGVGVFLVAHWSYRYGQQFYWLGYLALLFMTARAGLPSARRASSPARSC